MAFTYYQMGIGKTEGAIKAVFKEARREESKVDAMRDAILDRADKARVPQGDIGEVLRLAADDIGKPPPADPIMWEDIDIEIGREAYRMLDSIHKGKTTYQQLVERMSPF